MALMKHVSKFNTGDELKKEFWTVILFKVTYE